LQQSIAAASSRNIFSRLHHKLELVNSWNFKIVSEKLIIRVLGAVFPDRGNLQEMNIQKRRRAAATNLISAAISVTSGWRSLHIPPYYVSFSKEIRRNVENSGQISETTRTHLLWLLYRRKFHFLEDQVPIASVYMEKYTIPFIVWRRLSKDPNHMHNCIFWI
uniref:Zf-RVT domain-containing protein n=1 Tax=Heligmosomoides polygyrus TaxID=6339 RepID=A0A183GEZ4_HELPZ